MIVVMIMIIMTEKGFNALLKQIHRRLPNSGGKISGTLIVEKDFEVKGHATEQLASYPGMKIIKITETQIL